MSRIKVLDGKGRRDDTEAIRTLLNGGCVFDGSGSVIAAPTLSDLPPGLYQLTPVQPPPRR